MVQIQDGLAKRKDCIAPARARLEMCTRMHYKKSARHSRRPMVSDMATYLPVDRVVQHVLPSACAARESTHRWALFASVQAVRVRP